MLINEGLQIEPIITSNDENPYDCRVCENKFTSPNELIVHYVSHGMHPCTKCTKLFTSQSLADKHFQYDHRDQIKECHECPKRFPTESSFGHHVEIENGKNLCRACDSLISNGKLRSHITEVHHLQPTSFQTTVETLFLLSTDKHFQCELCNTRLNLDRFFPHYLYLHKFSLQCLFGEILKQGCNFATLRLLCDDDGSVDEYSYCGTCGDKYTILAPKIVHKIYCDGVVYCRLCDSCFRSQEFFANHFENCASRHRNEENSSGFCDMVEVQPEHYMEKHGLNSLATKSIKYLFDAEFRCSFCLVSLANEAHHLDRLIAHYKTVHSFNHSIILTLLKKCPNGSKKNMTRPIANYLKINEITNEESAQGVIDFDSRKVRIIYSSASDYDSHDSDAEDSLSASKRAPIQCTLCNFRSISKFVHAKHLSQRHGFLLKSQEFRCNSCRKEFTSYASLHKHNKTTHHKRRENGQKRFACAFCDFATNNKTRIR